MTAAELIELAKKVAPETEVWFVMRSGCCGDIEEMVIEDAYAEVVRLGPNRNRHVMRVSFDPLPGYRFCGHVAETRRRYVGEKK